MESNLTCPECGSDKVTLGKIVKDAGSLARNASCACGFLWTPKVKELAESGVAAPVVLVDAEPEAPADAAPEAPPPADEPDPEPAGDIPEPPVANEPEPPAEPKLVKCDPDKLSKGDLVRVVYKGEELDGPVARVTKCKVYLDLGGTKDPGVNKDNVLGRLV